MVNEYEWNQTRKNEKKWSRVATDHMLNWNRLPAKLYPASGFVSIDINPISSLDEFDWI